MSIKSKWTDLGPRLLSALVMVAVGAAALWQGGVAFVLLVAAVAGLMIWELSTCQALKNRFHLHFHKDPLFLCGATGAQIQ